MEAEREVAHPLARDCLRKVPDLVKLCRCFKGFVMLPTSRSEAVLCWTEVSKEPSSFALQKMLEARFASVFTMFSLLRKYGKQSFPRS